MKKHGLRFSAILCCLVIAFQIVSAQSAKTYEFTNGNWFDGKTFERKTLYSVNGIFVAKRPARIDEIVDLKNGYVIPPFADAHSHKLDIKSELAEQESRFVKEGTMYVMVLNNHASNAATNRHLFNKPGALDVVYANGGITRTGEHPSLSYERIASGIAEWWSPENTKIIQASRIAERDAYWFFDTISDV